MNTTTNPEVSKSQSIVRDELGRFAGAITSERAERQEAIDANVNHWRWLNQHGYTHVEPSEIFAGK